MSYIEYLTDEDIELLMKICVETPEEIEKIHHPLSNNSTSDYILVRTVNGNELQIRDYEFRNAYGCHLKEDASKAFSAYMAYKFGTLYLKAYTESKTHVNYYKNKVEEALDKLSEVQKEAKAEEEKLLEYYNDFDFTSLFNGPIKLS